MKKYCDIAIRKFKDSDTEETSLLISNTFAEFNNKEGSKKAIQNYIDMYNSKITDIKYIKNNFFRTDIFFVATHKNKIVGMIRGKENRIINLFVDGKYHNRGIAKKIVERFEQECIKKGTLEIKVRPSLYSASFYQKVGYKKTTGVRNFRGLNIFPMRKTF
jgi:GNAT superfamily N-acetyltransferase